MADETGWLIEAWDSKRDELKARWWAAGFEAEDAPGVWTNDSTKALRFARECDAQAYIDETGWTEAKPTACDHKQRNGDGAASLLNELLCVRRNAMSVSNATVALCQHCGRPIGGVATWLGGLPYHPECTHGPSYPTHYAPLPAEHPGCRPTPALTEDDVRRIVRDELTHNNQGNRTNPRSG